MAFVNYNNKEITVKIVYYGPALSGKTTCLQYTYASKEYKKKGKLITLDTDGDRTLFFDFLPIEIGKLGDYSIKMQLYTVPGQVAYDTTRKLVLQGSDGIVFVADSQVVMREQNMQSFNNLKENLKANKISYSETPLIFQFNKRDLREILPLETLNKDLNRENKPFFPTIATNGENVLEGLHTIMKMVIIYLKNKLSIFQKDKTVMFSREEISDTMTAPNKMAPKPVAPKPVFSIENGDKEEDSSTFSADTEKEEVFELSAPIDEEALKTQDYPPEEDIFNLGDESAVSNNPMDDLEVPDVVLQDELGDLNSEAQNTPKPKHAPEPIVAYTQPDPVIEFEDPEPLVLSDDEPLELADAEPLELSDPELDAEPISLGPEMAQAPQKKEQVMYTAPVNKSNAGVPVTSPEVAVSSNMTANTTVSAKASAGSDNVDIPLNITIPIDKKEVKININLQITVTKE